MILLFGAIVAIVPSAWSYCGGTGTLTPQNPSYIFGTPNYPSHHPTPIVCTWNINAPSSTTELKIECSVNTARNTGCLSSYISLREGQIVRKYCGTGSLNTKIGGSSTTLMFESTLLINFGYEGISCKVSYTPKSDEPIPTLFPPNPSCKCGQKGGNRIVGGEEATPNEYPWQALLMFKSTGKQFCGGSVILEDWILSAAHCVEHETASNLAVILGEHDYFTADQNTQRFDVEKFIIHEKYHQGGPFNNDITVLKLKTRATYNLVVSPICLPFNYKMVELSGKPATISGWGLTVPGDYTSPSNVLKEHDLKLLKNTECTYSNGYSWSPSQITETMICGIADKESACQGDSGGPLVWKNPANDLYFEVGVVSFGGTCASPQSPVVYTKVQMYVDWIKEKTGAGNEFCIE